MCVCVPLQTEFGTQQNNPRLLHVFAGKVLNRASLRKLSGMCVCTSGKPRRTFLFSAFQTFGVAPPPALLRTTSTTQARVVLQGTVAAVKRAETKICQSIH